MVAVILFEVILNGMAMFNHGNVGLPERLDRRLRWLLVTPDMHRVHHSVAADEANSNFGFNLSLWDRLFGTYREPAPRRARGMTIGIDDHRDPRRGRTACRGCWLLPFRGAVTDYAINRRDLGDAGGPGPVVKGRGTPPAGPGCWPPASSWPWSTAEHLDTAALTALDRRRRGGRPPGLHRPLCPRDRPVPAGLAADPGRRRALRPGLGHPLQPDRGHPRARRSPSWSPAIWPPTGSRPGPAGSAEAPGAGRRGRGLALRRLHPAGAALSLQPAELRPGAHPHPLPAIT